LKSSKLCEDFENTKPQSTLRFTQRTQRKNSELCETLCELCGKKTNREAREV